MSVNTHETHKSIELCLYNFLFYVILTISYLRACSIVQGWNVIFTQRFRAAPVKQIDISYFMSNFLYIRASY